MMTHSQRTIEQRIPPEVFFVTSAVFHYLGPAFAILLFAQIAPLGVAWLRIVSAAIVLALFSSPPRLLSELRAEGRGNLLALGVVLAAMNMSFYLALALVPLSTVAAIEFVGPIALAAFGLRGPRNTIALSLAAIGVYFLLQFSDEGTMLGYAFAFANCALFVLYVVLGHRIAERGGSRGIRRLALSMVIAAILAVPIGICDAAPAFASPELLAASIGVGVCSSVIPYVLDQLAMARLSRETFALLLTMLPATATVVGVLVLEQIPTVSECVGIALVIAGVALHRRAS